MHNIKLTIEYAGTNYAGWQVQNKKYRTIQETLEKALHKVLQKRIKIIGSGRTDAGVHATAQVANFKTNSIMPVQKLQKALNAVLPDDIVITKTEKVDLDFHSRFDTKSKIYRYVILNRVYPCALLKDKVYFFPYPLDVALMRREAKRLLGEHDFRAFCASGSICKDTVRTIKRIDIKKSAYNLPFMAHRPEGSPFITIDIEADGFLYNMVRNIVGTLIEIGRARFSEGSLKKILESRDRKLAGPTAPARGLFLIKVNY